jgi:hypothetical protein
MSQPAVGFVLLTHEKPHQTKRLATTLNKMLDSPPIACHHNFSVTPLSVEEMPANIQFVQPHVKTRWGKFSTMEAILKALRILYEDPNSPDWFVFLTGGDYPIKPANVILEQLASTPFDAFIHHEKVDYYNRESRWQIYGFERYCIVRGWVPALDENFRPKKLFFPLLQHPSLTRFFTPFSDDFPCYVGELHFTINRKALRYLLEFHDSHPALAKYYKNSTIFPPESYFQTILCNAPDLSVENNSLRFIEWSTGTAHPKTLDISDLGKMQVSPAHFARKFDIDKDPAIYDCLDEMVLGNAQPGENLVLELEKAQP